MVEEVPPGHSQIHPPCCDLWCWLQRQLMCRSSRLCYIPWTTPSTPRHVSPCRPKDNQLRRGSRPKHEFYPPQRLLNSGIAWMWHVQVNRGPDRSEDCCNGWLAYDPQSFARTCQIWLGISTDLETRDDTGFSTQDTGVALFELHDSAHKKAKITSIRQGRK